MLSVIKILNVLSIYTSFKVVRYALKKKVLLLKLGIKYFIVSPLFIIHLVKCFLREFVDAHDRKHEVSWYWMAQLNCIGTYVSSTFSHIYIYIHHRQNPHTTSICTVTVESWEQPEMGHRNKSSNCSSTVQAHTAS